MLARRRKCTHTPTPTCTGTDKCRRYELGYNQACASIECGDWPASRKRLDQVSTLTAAQLCVLRVCVRPFVPSCLHLCVLCVRPTHHYLYHYPCPRLSISAAATYLVDRHDTLAC